MKKEIIKEQQWSKDLDGKWKEKEVEVKTGKVEVQISDPAKSMHIQDKSTGEKLASLIVDFTKQATTKNVTDKAVAKFYDNIIKVQKKIILPSKILRV